MHSIGKPSENAVNTLSPALPLPLLRTSPHPGKHDPPAPRIYAHILQIAIHEEYPITHTPTKGILGSPGN